MKILGLIRIIGAAAATTAALVTLAFAATVGQAARLPSIAWSPVTSPGTFDYGTVDVGQAESQTFVLTNSGGAATGALSVSLGGTAELTITADACTGTALGPGKSCNVSVQYAPTTAGQSTATLAANGIRPPARASITLTGTGVAVAPDLVLSPGTFIGGINYFYEFGVVQRATTTFTITNNGTGASNELFVTGGELSNNTCDHQALAPGGTCTFDLTVTAPTGCNPGEAFNTFLDVFGSPFAHYIQLYAFGTCPP